jgi:branched-chain amino acid transport system substrate-binding protein
MKRRMMIRTFQSVAVLLGISLILFPTYAKALRPIKVGIVDSYSGPAAVYANDALNGFKLALDKINQKGVLGTKIEITTRDDKFKVDIGLSMTKEMVMREEVDILAGTGSSGVAMAVSDYVKVAKVPFIVWMSKSERITGEKGHRYVFSTSENTAMVGKAGAIGLTKKLNNKFWIAGDDYEFGHALGDGTWRNIKILRPQAELIGTTWWKVGEPDLLPYIMAIMSAKPDAVIFGTGGASMTNVMKVIKVTGMAEKVQIWINGATEHAVLKPLGLEAPEGVMGTADYHFYFPNSPANKGFVKAYQDAYGYLPGFAAYKGYITAHFIAEAFKKAGNINREKFIDALEGLKIDGPVGEIEMRAYDHQVVVPIFLSVTKKVPEYNFLISTDFITLPGKDVMPTIEEIKKARGGL